MIGAGFAGLAAADALAARGAEVTVLEARDRVGGRVWSQHLANGALVEMGADFFEDDHATLHGLVRRFGLTVTGRGMAYATREPRGVDTTAEAVAAAAARVRAAGTVVEALAAAPITEAEREAIRARVEVSCGHDAAEIDAAVLAGFGSSFDGAESRRILEGNGAIAAGLARAVGSRVRLQTPAEAVAWTESGVRVRTPAGEVTADAAIVALPAAVLKTLPFDPPLSAAKRDVLAALPIAQAAKLFVAARAPTAPSAVLSVPERYWTWTARGANGNVTPVVNCFAGSAAALRRLEVDDGPATWVESLRRLRPDLSLDADDLLLSTWTEQWSRGVYAVHTGALGTDDWDALTRREGPLVFCGEHTRSDHSGLMEGALRSGLRAADEALG